MARAGAAAGLLPLYPQHAALCPACLGAQPEWRSEPPLDRLTPLCSSFLLRREAELLTLRRGWFRTERPSLAREGSSGKGQEAPWRRWGQDATSLSWTPP